MKLWATLIAFPLAAIGLGDRPYIDFESLPNKTIWPGPWEKYIKAPKDKTRITPARIWKASGNVTTSGIDAKTRIGHEPGGGIAIGPGGVLTLEFEENIAGRVCFEVEAVDGEPEVNLAYSESSWFADTVPDATTDRLERDLPLAFKFGNGTGRACVDPEFVRGGFKYLTISLPRQWPAAAEGQGRLSRLWDTVDYLGAAGQKILGYSGHDSRRPLSSYLSSTSGSNRAWVSLSDVWVNCTAFPSQTNGRAYSGYFYSSSNLLNRIWYAGAYTLQLSTIDPKEGSALIDLNRVVDGNTSPQGSWYSNFTISNGTAVTTDGAKRDRMVWPGDMYVAIPGIAMSTFDMSAVRNALDVLYAHQYPDGSLPYAGPPMGHRGEFSDTYHMHTLLGTYFYVLYSGDLSWLQDKWPAYLRALNVSISKVDSLGLLHVSSTFDCLRPGMTGHNLEASAILHDLLSKSTILAGWLKNCTSTSPPSWVTLQQTLEAGLARLYCPRTALFSDNVGARSCHGSSHVDPQDGNSWVLISRLNLTPAATPWLDPKSPIRLNTTISPAPSPSLISTALRNRWTKFGAPAPEFPNVISPFASGFELLAHAAAEQIDSAVELMLLEWGYLLDGPGFTNSTLAEGFRIDGHVQYPAYWSAARNSHAHGWSSAPTSVLMQEVLGIKVLGPTGGGDEWEVKPRLSRWLGWARGGFATGRGRWEVKIWRVREVTERTDGRKGVVVVVDAPGQTKGRVVLGDGEGVLYESTVAGGGTRAWVMWYDDGYDMAEEVEELQPGVVVAEEEGEIRKNWYNRDLVYNDGITVLEYDDEFEPLEMQEREAGVVDWEAMEEHFTTPPAPGWDVRNT
ncbi:Six-hairpin glycosidase-like protein [Coniochaeta sp. 2T2.1]|nr:Six-hairpin glycosidase-like protein [Coniochaeta sp. 2T2.1]